MNRATVTAQQTRAIHALRRSMGLPEADYRAILQREFNAASSTALSEGEAGRLIEKLKEMAGQKPGQRLPSRRAVAKTADGRYAAPLQALWIAAWNLAIVRSRDDAAMMKFVERQTGVSHTRFLNDPKDATRAIEGLKAWITREGGVQWPPIGRDVDRKTEVARAIAARLVAEGVFKPYIEGTTGWPGDFEQYGHRHGLPSAFVFYSAKDWDALANRLGAWLRGHRARQAKHAPGKAA